MTKKPSTFTALVTLNGRVTIPPEIRKLWTIKDGDYVEMEVQNVSKATRGEAE